MKVQRSYGSLNGAKQDKRSVGIHFATEEDRSLRIEEDRLLTAFHEAGHAVLALTVGAKWAEPWIALRTTGYDLHAQSAFTGKCVRGSVNGKIKLAMIGYAGLVAETIVEGYSSYGSVPGSVVEVHDDVDYELTWHGSASDRERVESLDPRFRWGAFIRCLSVLVNQWSIVSGIAFSVHQGTAGRFTPSDLMKQHRPGHLLPDLLRRLKKSDLAAELQVGQR